LRQLRAARVNDMDKTARTAAEVISELRQFAREHGFLLAQSECLRAHADKYIDLGHCPCVDSRLNCPCEEALSDIERLGRCECGILIDPVRLCLLKKERTDSKCDPTGG